HDICANDIKVRRDEGHCNRSALGENCFCLLIELAALGLVELRARLVEEFVVLRIAPSAVVGAATSSERARKPLIRVSAESVPGLIHVEIIAVRPSSCRGSFYEIEGDS